jgi:hypothetical protein
MHISPAIDSPYRSRQRAMKSSASSRQHARLLRLGAGVDFHEQQRRAVLLADFLGQRLAQAWPVDRMDGVEQRHRLLRLVRLQRPDHVQFQVRVPSDERRPLGLGLLHAVLAEHALPLRR